MENKYLFVCYANKNRSIVGECVFREMLLEQGFSVGGFKDSGAFDFYVGSAGINPENEAKRFSLEMIDGVRNVFVADEKIKRLLKSDYQYEDESRLVNLGIPDIYDISVEKQRKVLESNMRLKLMNYIPHKKWLQEYLNVILS